MEDEKERRRRNQELVAKMKRGESLTSFDANDSWFPVRPVIKKNLEDVKRVAGEKPSLAVTDD